MIGMQVQSSSLDFNVKVGKRRMLAKLSFIIDKPLHPLYETVGGLSSFLSNTLRHYCVPLIPSAIRLFNILDIQYRDTLLLKETFIYFKHIILYFLLCAISCVIH